MDFSFIENLNPQEIMDLYDDSIMEYDSMAAGGLGPLCYTLVAERHSKRECLELEGGRMVRDRTYRDMPWKGWTWAWTDPATRREQCWVYFCDSRRY